MKKNYYYFLKLSLLIMKNKLQSTLYKCTTHKRTPSLNTLICLVPSLGLSAKCTPFIYTPCNDFKSPIYIDNILSKCTHVTFKMIFASRNCSFYRHVTVGEIITELVDIFKKPNENTDDLDEMDDSDEVALI